MAQSHDHGADSLEQWWEKEVAVGLTRAEWSQVVEALVEQAEIDEVGDHIDQMAAEARRDIVQRISPQVNTDAPGDLLKGKEPYENARDEDSRIGPDE